MSTHPDPFGRSLVKVAHAGRLRRAGTIEVRASRKGVSRASHIRLDPFGSPENGRDQLVLKLLPLVKRMALNIRRRLPAHVELDDLVGAGSLGLLDAVRKFDPAKRVRIETYARHRIRGAMLDNLRTMDGASRDLRRKSKRFAKAYRDLETRTGQPVGNEELAGELGISMGEYYGAIRELQAVGFIGARTSAAAASVPLEEALAADDRQDPFKRSYKLEQQEIVRRAVAELPQRERLIIALYYQQSRTMREIAAKLSVDQSRVSQLHSAALVRLRKRVNTFLRVTPAAPAERANGRPREAIDRTAAEVTRASS